MTLIADARFPFTLAPHIAVRSTFRRFQPFLSFFFFFCPWMQCDLFVHLPFTRDIFKKLTLPSLHTSNKVREKQIICGSVHGAFSYKTPDAVPFFFFFRLCCSFSFSRVKTALAGLSGTFFVCLFVCFCQSFSFPLDISLHVYFFFFFP